MSSRNAYLSKLLFAQSLEPFDFTYRGMKYLLFTPKKGQRHYGSVAKQSHVITDYRLMFENYNNLLDSVMFFVDTDNFSDLYYLFHKKSCHDECCDCPLDSVENMMKWLKRKCNNAEEQK